MDLPLPLNSVDTSHLGTTLQMVSASAIDASAFYLGASIVWPLR